jgi:predicted Zn-dependent protease
MPRESLKLYLTVTFTPEVERQIAFVSTATGDFAGAEKAIRRLLTKSPGDFELRRLLGDVLTWARKYDEAARQYEGLLKDRPDDRATQAALARIHLWGRRYDDALRLSSRLLRADPDRQESYADFVDAAASARSIGPYAPPALMSRLVRWAKRERARDGVILKRLSWVCQRVGRPVDATSLLRLVVELEPDNSQLRLQLADLLYDQRRYREAEAEYLAASR